MSIRNFIFAGLFLALLVAGILFFKRPGVSSEPTPVSEASTPVAPQPAAPRAPSAAQPPTIEALGKPLPSAKLALRDFSVDDFTRAFPGDWDVVNTPDGKPQTLGGGRFALPSFDANGALSAARLIAPHFGVPGETMIPAANPQNQTLARTAFRFEQTHEGLPVFQASLSVIALNKTGEVTMITNDLRPIARTESGPALSAQKAGSEYENASPENGKVRSINGPIYFVDKAVATPAYIAIVKSEGAEFEEQIVLDANTARVLHRQPMGYH